MNKVGLVKTEGPGKLENAENVEILVKVVLKAEEVRKVPLAFAPLSEQVFKA